MKIQENRRPSQEENEKLVELFLAIYFNDLEKVLAFKAQFPSIYAKKNFFRIDEETTFDLKFLTHFNQVIWFDDDWAERVSPLVEKHRLCVKQMQAFWLEELGEEMKWDYSYNKYWKHFYCLDPNEEDERDYILYGTISSLLEKGFREIDLKLYNRADCLDFKEVKKLLDLGADPSIKFSEQEFDSSTDRRISDEVSYIASCEILPEFRSYESKDYQQHIHISTMFKEIIGLAAHIEMRDLLETGKLLDEN